MKAVADLCFYAPIGFLIEAPHLLPRLVQTGRDRLHRQLPVRPTSARRRRPGTPAGSGKEDQATREDQAANGAEPAARRGEDESAPDVVALGPAPTAGEAGGFEQVRATGAAEAPGAGGPVGDDDTGELPIPGYDQLAASQVVARLNDLDPADLLVVEAYEASHRRRRTILNRIAQLRGT